MKALFFDQNESSWTLFENPASIVEARCAKDMAGLLPEIERRVREEGLFAAGFLAYESAPAFDPSLRARTPQPELSLACFGLFRESTRLAELPVRGDSLPCRVSPFAPSISREYYERSFDRVREYLGAGDSYQVNLSYQLEARYSGDPFSWFAERVREKPLGYPAYLELEGYAICSLSPELFFERQAGDAPHTLILKPMKGTVRNEEGRERELSEFLRNDPKNRAENLMIVDMARNDAGRIALPGSVSVPSLFQTEAYPTVIQMTSTVEAKTNAGLSAIFGALFPCASITGAPKRRSMDIIAELETEPRGIYTGTLGFIRPGGTARFSVAIRTALFDAKSRIARYGVGGGIVWESKRDGEFEETLVKAAALREEPGFYVFESMLLEGGAFYLLGRHLERLSRSIRFFGLDRLGPNRYGYDVDDFMSELSARLGRVARDRQNGRYKVRVTVRPEDGPGTDCEIAVEGVPPLPSDYTVALARNAVRSDDPFTGHKTSRRYFIEKALAARPDSADLILMNERGELTETTRGNIAVLLDGELFTPPLPCGVLSGTMRAEMIDRGRLRERVLFEDDYRSAEKIFMINSVRGSVECRRIDVST